MHPYYLFIYLESSLYGISFICFSLVLVTGNLLTVLVILTAKHMQTTTNILIGSMASAEFLTLLLTPILQVSSYIW